MRKSAYGPLRCDRCTGVLDGPELRVLQQTHFSTPLHLGCMAPIDKTRTLVRLIGTHCLFCGVSMRLPDLMEHFNAAHGRVITNW